MTFFDLSAAFDTLDVELFLAKLKILNAMHTTEFNIQENRPCAKILNLYSGESASMLNL